MKSYINRMEQQIYAPVILMFMFFLLPIVLIKELHYSNKLMNKQIELLDLSLGSLQV
jgi:hypothetical protein